MRGKSGFAEACRYLADAFLVVVGAIGSATEDDVAGFVASGGDDGGDALFGDGKKMV